MRVFMKTNQAERDFSKDTIRILKEKGIRIIGIQALPDMSNPLPWANADTGYILDDNGCGKVCSHRQVINLTA